MKGTKKLVPNRRFKEFQDAEAWEEFKLNDVLEYEQPSNYIVESTEYDNRYSTPVLTAGQSFLLGYTDEKTGIKKASKNSPIIIFDDFTTSSHYVDFPFKVKSSAMKLLSLKQEKNNFYFVLNALKNINYTPQCHERHWISKFSNLNVLMPSYDEQNQIGEFLRNIDNLITLHQRKLDKIKSMKKAYLFEMFPAVGESKPKRRFKGFTDDWKLRKFGDVSEIMAGGTPSTQIKSYWEPKEIPWLSSGEVHKKRITYTDNMISKNGLENSSARWIKQNSVLVALAGQGKTRGTVAINHIPLTTNQSIAAIILNKELHYEFVFQNLENRYDELRALSSAGGSRGGLNKQILSELNIRTPRFEEQVKISSFLKGIDTLITLYQQKLDKLKNLKKSYLNEMFI